VAPLGTALDVIGHKDMTQTVENHHDGIHTDGDAGFRWADEELEEHQTDGFAEFLWEHLFPGKGRRTVVISLREGEEDLDEAVMGVRDCSGRSATTS